MKRGTLVHRLFERLADVTPDDRRSIARPWLRALAGEMPESEQEAILDMVCEILTEPRFAPLFAEGSLAEAPLAATLGDGRVVAGTVDRLLVEPDRVLVVDFKTGRVPGAQSDIPVAHRNQMQAYKQALATIFPGRTVDAALLYTDGPQLLPVDG